MIEKKEVENIAWGDEICKRCTKWKSLNISEIGLALNDYSDIFSDFDPRPYSERALSDDFLLEAKKASREKVSGEIELKFLLSKEKRNLEHEHMIKRRLHEHFRKHHEIMHREVQQIMWKGISFIVIGIALMLAATLVMFKYSDKTILTNFLIILMEPGGWFFFWEGLGQIVFEAKKKRPDLEFYEKMSKCHIGFFSY